MQSDPKPGARWSVPAVWFAVALLVYLWLGADVFYKTDGPDLLRLLDEGKPHPWHVGYLPLLTAWRALLGVFGIEPSLLRLGDSLSALGMAAGVAFFHAGLRRLGTAPAVRDAAVLLLAVNPAALLFASVVEFHGPLLGVVGVAFWWTCAQVGRPAWWGMALLGCLSHAAFLVHSSGLLLPAWLLAFYVARRWPAGARRGDLLLAALALAVHAAAWLLLPRLFPAFYGLHADFLAAYSKETSIGRPQSLDHLPEIFWQEWLRPLLPVSVACFLALGRRALRLEFAAFAVGLAPFLYLCVRQLVFEPEHGAYLLPLVPAAAALTAAALPVAAARARSALAALVVASLVFAWVERRAALGEGTGARYGAFVGDLQRAAAGAPFVALVGRHEEMAMGYARLSPMREGELVPTAPDAFLWVRSQATLPRAGFEDAWKATRTGLVAWLSAGRAVLLTAGARASLADPVAVMRSEKATVEVPDPDSISGPLFLAALEREFTLQPAAGPAGAPTVFRVLPR